MIAGGGSSRPVLHSPSSEETPREHKAPGHGWDDQSKRMLSNSAIVEKKRQNGDEVMNESEGNNHGGEQYGHAPTYFGIVGDFWRGWK